MYAFVCVMRVCIGIRAPGWLGASVGVQLGVFVRACVRACVFIDVRNAVTQMLACARFHTPRYHTSGIDACAHNTPYTHRRETAVSCVARLVRNVGAGRVGDTAGSVAGDESALECGAEGRAVGGDAAVELVARLVGPGSAFVWEGACVCVSGCADREDATLEGGPLHAYARTYTHTHTH